MYYRVEKDGLQETDALPLDGQHIAIVLPGDIPALATALPAYADALDAIAQAKALDMEITQKYAYGALRLPKQTGMPLEGASMGFLFSGETVVLIGSTKDTCRWMAEAINRDDGRDLSLDRVVFRFFAGLVQGDARRLEDIEVQLSALEDAVIKEKMGKFNEKMSPLRRRIRRLRVHYGRLEDLAGTLVESELHFFAPETLFSLRRLLEAIQRLNSHTQILREYALQVQEIYQAQIDILQNQTDIRQNNIMRVLTVITTVFFPLSLITSWYGMNFTGMRELEWQYGYPAVAVLSVVVVAVSLWICKKKKYL